MDSSLFSSFGLHENPFSVNPDPRHLFLTAQTQKALDGLIMGIQTRQGLILLTGDVGTGKTTLINSLLDWLESDGTPKAFIFNSHLEPQELFELMLADFGVPGGGRGGSAFARLNAWLLECHRSGRTAVLIIDEAQGLPSHTLEEIRLLLNLETTAGKLLQIVLCGQPELEQRLRRVELRQIQQRIAFRCRTTPMTLEETRACIQHRLRVAGTGREWIFSLEAMDSAYFYSRGIPRVINLLCEHALLKAYAAHVRPVPASMIEEASRELQFDADRPVAALRPAEASVPRANLIAMQPTSDGSQMAFAGAAGAPVSQHQDGRNLTVGDLAAVKTAVRLPADEAGPQTAESASVATVARKPTPLAAKAAPSGQANAFAPGRQEDARRAYSNFSGSTDVDKIIAELSRTTPSVAPVDINSAGTRRSRAATAGWSRELPAWRAKLSTSRSIKLAHAIFDEWLRAEPARQISRHARSLQSYGQRFFKRYAAKASPGLQRLSASFVIWLKEPVPLAPIVRANPGIRDVHGETFGWFSSFTNKLRDRAEPVVRWLATPVRPAHRR